MKDAKIIDFPINSINPYKSDIGKMIGPPYNCTFTPVNLVEISKLNKNGLKVLHYIALFSASSPADYMELNITTISQEMFGDNTSEHRNFIYRGVNELLAYGVIARSVTRNFYWLNRNVI